jgi:hypothetical protein
VEVRKPIWTSSTFLLYLGGLTVLVSALGSLVYLGTNYSQGELVAWTLLPLVVLNVVAHALRARGAWIAAGVFAFSWVAVWAVFLAILFRWFGWHLGSSSSAFHGWHWSLWLLELLVIAAAAGGLQRFRFPSLMIYVLFGWWLLVTDVISGGGNWSAVVTLFFGVTYLFVGVAIDRGRSRPYGFWWHFVSGLLVGGSLLYWWHSSELDWALLTTASVIFILLAGVTWRSTWAVIGAAGIVAASTHWTFEWVSEGFSLSSPSRTWVPFVVFAVVGFAFVLLGLYIGRRRGPDPAAP